MIRKQGFQKGKNNPNYGGKLWKGKNNPMYGKKHSLETIRKMSEVKIGNKNALGKHWKVKDTSKMKGHHSKTEFKKGCISPMLGKKLSKETKIKISKNHEDVSGEKNHMFGRYHSEKSKEKIRNSDYHKNNSGKNSPMYGKKNPSMAKWNKEKRLGKTYEELYGKVRAKKMRKRASEIFSLANKGKPKSKEHIQIIKENRAKQIFPLKDTSIEVKIQNFLKQLKIEFYTHSWRNEIKYKYRCDILIPVQEGITQKIVIECDGDYWHGNPEIKNFMEYPKHSREQRILDFERTNQLEEKGFRVIRLWGSKIKVMEVNDLRSKIICKI